eukprot:superscaffoldBa00003172_g16308
MLLQNLVSMQQPSHKGRSKTGNAENKNNTDSLSVAPVRYPVVQISSKLHIMKQNKKRNKGNNKESKPLNLEEL